MKKVSAQFVLPICVLFLVVLFLAFIAFSLSSADVPQGESSLSEPSSQEVSSKETNPQENTSNSSPEIIANNNGLDTSYSRLELINAKNPLDKSFVPENLTEIPSEYLNGQLAQIDSGIYPYLIAMIKAAKEDGLTLYVRSPYRSYATQTMLFDNQVKSLLNKGYSAEEADNEAATVVARPGTSEHQSGLAVDINSTSDSFKKTKEYSWLTENAADFGFIMRYPEEKSDITGIIYEPWHYRFVGIKTAKEINGLGMCLEEYLEYKNQ